MARVTFPLYGILSLNSRRKLSMQGGKANVSGSTHRTSRLAGIARMKACRRSEPTLKCLIKWIFGTSDPNKIINDVLLITTQPTTSVRWFPACTASPSDYGLGPRHLYLIRTSLSSLDTQLGR